MKSLFSILDRDGILSIGWGALLLIVLFVRVL